MNATVTATIRWQSTTATARPSTTIGATSWDVADYLDGNYLRSVKALEYYLRFVGGQHRQISARTLAVELGVYDVERLKCLLRGLSTTQPDLLSYTDTLDLDALTIR